MLWWRQLRHLYQAAQRRRAARKLVILPVVLVSSGLYLASVTGYVFVSHDRLVLAETVAWHAFVCKLLLAMGTPLALGVWWKRAKHSQRVLSVVDWLGSGIVAYSMVWMGAAFMDLLPQAGMERWAWLLIPHSMVFWGLLGSGLLVTGTISLARDLSTEWRERQRLQALMEFTQRMTSLDYQAILNEAVRHLHRLLEADACVLYLWNDEEQVLVPAAGYHDPRKYPAPYVQRMMSFRCPLGFGITGWVMQSGTPYVSGDVMSDVRSQAVPGWHGEEKSCLLAPIQVEGRRLGVVRLTRQGLNQFTQADLHLAQSFAGQAALVIEHGRIVKELSDMSITDSMTSLYNARHFHQVAAVEISRSQRSEQPLALIMVDSDSLKQMNDNKGHLRGDQYLRMISRVLAQNTRLCDYAFRYAGDEFLLLLPNTDLEGALMVAERVRTLIEAYETEDGMSGTVSLGVAVYPDHAGDAESLLTAADRAMYESKRTGKNRVTTANSAFTQPDQWYVDLGSPDGEQ